MIIFNLGLLLSVFLLTQGTPAAVHEIVMTKATPPNGISKCLRNLPAGTLRIQMICRVNAIAGPSRCTFEPETATREQKYAAMCASRAYQFRYEDGQPATGRTVTYSVYLTVA